jgi:hypothetical protein
MRGAGLVSWAAAGPEAPEGELTVTGAPLHTLELSLDVEEP